MTSGQVTGALSEEWDQVKHSGTLVISEYIEYTGVPAGLKDIEQRFHEICSTLRALMRQVDMAVDEADWYVFVSFFFVFFCTVY